MKETLKRLERAKLTLERLQTEARAMIDRSKEAQRPSGTRASVSLSRKRRRG